jgi:hypothetical protein
MTNEKCAECGKGLGTEVQEELFGDPKTCSKCVAKKRIKMILACLPEKGGRGWNSLQPDSRKFLTSIRNQFARKGDLSLKQYQWLEDTWSKV